MWQCDAARLLCEVRLTIGSGAIWGLQSWEHKSRIEGTMKLAWPTASVVVFLAVPMLLPIVPARAQSSRVAHKALVLYDFPKPAGRRSTIAAVSVLRWIW